MDQISQNIIPILNLCRIIFKCCSINFYLRSRKHLNDGILQPIIIHTDQRHNHLIRSRFRPVASELSLRHNTHNRFWIINLIAIEQISVIPFFYFIKVSAIFSTEFLYLFLSKSDVGCKLICLKHGKLIKIINSRLRFFLFNRQNSSKICKLDIFGWLHAFKHTS